MDKVYNWSIRFTHVLGYSAPTMQIVSAEKYSDVMKIAKNKSELGRFSDKWTIEVLDKEPWPFRKPKKFKKD